MATEKQINANRQNASKSTGPKTPQGKAAVSQNSFKHGMYAAQGLFPGESRAEFDLHRDQIYEEYNPVGTIEKHLVELIAIHLWRLRHSNRTQIAAVNSLHHSHNNSVIRGLDAFLKPKNDKTPPPDLELGQIAVKDFTNSKVIGNLLMHERRIENSLFKTIAELERRQMIRKMEVYKSFISDHAEGPAKTD
ncbi:MAG TPA: hypothetical protein ENH94_06230 [Phycisphaerales bacterium]|nr:hypothetical protein [Phycisphaerales bacterium]